MSRRRFLKNITGMLVATAIPKPLLNVSEITDNKESFLEIARAKQAKRLRDQAEKIIWATNGEERMRITSNQSIYINYDKL